MTKDYYSVLARATSALDPNTEQARRAVYDRARVAIMDAGLSSSQTSAEREALENAIERVEAEVERAQHPPPLHAPAQAPAESIPPAARTERTPGKPAVPRHVILAASAAALLLVVVAAGVAYWPRGGGSNLRTPPKTTEAPTAVAERTTTGSGDVSYIFKRQLVYYRTIHPPGTIVIAKSQRFLYLVRPEVVALRYTVGIGRDCANAVGLLIISAKEERPATDTSPRLASAGGTSSQPGARSLSLGDTGHRIYGTSPPIVSGADGCFRLVDEDVTDLYDRVSVGTRVVIN